MSHVADCDIKIKDLAAAELAAKALGGELVRDKKTHEWYGRFLNDWGSDRAAVNRRDPKTFGKCDHVIKFPGIRYEIGLCKEEDGSFTPVYDNFGSGGGHDGQLLEKKIGISGSKLKDEYAAAVTTRLLARRGFRVSRSVDAKGAIVLRAVN